VLYTITADSTLRIFMPVLDSQKYLQLHGAIDVPFTPNKKNDISSVFWIDRKVVGDALKKVLEETHEEDAQRRRAREVIEEGWDLFLRVMGDGSVLVTAVAVSALIHTRNNI
jgi:hypothetical protein